MQAAPVSRRHPPLGKYLELGFVSSVASSAKPSADVTQALGGALGCDSCGECMDIDKMPRKSPGPSLPLVLN